MTLIESCMKNKEKIVQLMKTNKKLIDDVEGIVKHKILNSPYNEVPEGLQRKLSAAIKSYAEFQETIQKRILWPAEVAQN
jgi:hypothetical protein